MDTWVIPNFCLLWILLLWARVYKYLFETLFTILCDIYTEVKLLHHIYIVTLFFLKTGKSISNVLFKPRQQQQCCRCICLPGLWEHLCCWEQDFYLSNRRKVSRGWAYWMGCSRAPGSFFSLILNGSWGELCKSLGSSVKPTVQYLHCAIKEMRLVMGRG